ncbi:hypothetical protein FRB98_003661 [Tulasnella sp. 332]|nr:hypothetical protein FRB98_003661 [Tulasnella sp. 332]
MTRSHSPPVLSSPSDRTRPKHRIVRQYRGARRTVRSQARTRANQTQTLQSPPRRRETGFIAHAFVTSSSPLRPGTSNAPIHGPRMLSEDEEDVFSSSHSPFRDHYRPLQRAASLMIPEICTTLRPHGALREITTAHAFNSSSQPDASVRHSHQHHQLPIRPLIPDRYMLPSPPRTCYNKPATLSPLLVARRGLASSSRHHLENASVRSSQNAINLSLTPLRPRIRTKPLGDQKGDSILGPISSSGRRASVQRTFSTPNQHGSPRLGRQIPRTPVIYQIRPHVAEVEGEIQEQDSIFSPSRTEGDLAVNASFFAAAPQGESTPFAQGNHLIDSILGRDTIESDMDISGQVIGTRPSEGDAKEEPANDTIRVQVNQIGTRRDSTQSSARASQVKANDPRSIKIAIHADSIISSFEQSISNVVASPATKGPPHFLAPPLVREEIQDSLSPNGRENVATHINLTGDQLFEQSTVKKGNISTANPTQDEQDDHEAPRVLSAHGCRLSVQPEEDAAERRPQANAGKEHRSSERPILALEEDDEVHVATDHDEEEPSPGSSHAVPLVKSPAPIKIRVLTKKPLRWKGKRVAMSSLDPKRLWMRVHDEPLTPEGSDDEPDILLLQQQA